MSSLSSHGRWEVDAGVEVEGFCVVHFVLFCCTQNAHLSVLWEFFECKTSKWLAHLNSISETVIWLNMPSCCWICCRYNDDRTWTNFICRFFALISCFYFLLLFFSFPFFLVVVDFTHSTFDFFSHLCLHTSVDISIFIDVSCMVFSRLLLVCGCRRYVFFCYKLISTFSSRIQHVHSIHEWSIEQFFLTRTLQDDGCALSTNTCTKFNTTRLLIDTQTTCYFWKLWMHFPHFLFNLCTFLHFPRIFHVS